MLNKPSSFVKYVPVFVALMVLSILIVKLNQNVIEVKSSHHLIRPMRTTGNVPFDQLLDLPIKFEFLLRPRAACDPTTQLIIFVHSKLDHFESRNEIRSTWGSIERQASLRYRLVFLIGLQVNENRTIEQQIAVEHQFNDDLVRGNFMDTYRNLTYKHVMGYKWILYYCAKVNFVMKSDDDAFINIFEIADLLNLNAKDGLGKNYELNKPTVSYRDDGRKPPPPKSYAEIKLFSDRKLKKLIYSNQRSLIGYKKLMKNLPSSKLKFVGCALQPNGTKVKRTGKWRLTRDEYDLDYFPPYCSGITYFLNVNALRSIYERAHQMNRILFIDDLFLTGIVVQQQIRQTNYSNYLNDSSDYSAIAAKDAYFKVKDYASLTTFERKLDYSRSGNKDAFLIVDWSEFYNFRWQAFVRNEGDNSFNSVFFINDLDKMPNRSELVQIAWKKMKNYYLVP